MSIYSGVSPLEAQQSAQKIVGYRRDYRKFAAEQLRIGDNPFNLWPCQIPLLESVERQFEERGFARCVWLKARQVGASTLAESLVAWRTMLWPHVNALVLADQAERARTLFEISRTFYDHLDDDIRPVGRYITKRELVFANPSQATRKHDPGLRSRIVVESAHKKNIAIGANWQVAHLSECARFPDPAFVLDGVIPAVHRVPGTIIIMESSAEMAGTWYRDFCEASMRGDTAFEFTFVPWYLQPEYCMALSPGEHLELSANERHISAEHGLTPGHIKWMREKLAEMGNDWDLFRQSFPLTVEDAWVTPGAQVFPMKNLRELRHGIRPPKRMAEVYAGPRILDSPQGRLSIWDEPESGKAYDIGVDVAMGQGRDDSSDTDLDSSVACVLERGSNKQVAEWASRSIDPFELANTLYWLGKYYNTAQVAVETNGIGGGTNQQLSKMGYGNCYIWRYRDEIVPRYSRKTGWECVVPEAKILTSDLQWVSAESLIVGSRLLGCDEIRPGKRERYRLKEQQVVNTRTFEAPLIEVILDNGQCTKVSRTHPLLSFRTSFPGWRWRSAYELRCGDLVKYLPLWKTLDTYDAGRLSAFLDGEGHLCQGKPSGLQLLISQAEGELAQEINELWASLGFNWTFKWLRHKKRPHEKPIATSGVIKISEVFKALGSLRPTRLLRRFRDCVDLSRITLQSISNAVVVSVRDVGVGSVVGITTYPDHTLIADGVVGHNTNTKSKPWLVGFAAHEMVNGRVQISSELLLRELEMFVQKGPNEWGAVAGHHDDRAISWMIALLTSDDESFEKYYGLQRLVARSDLSGQPISKEPESWECDKTFRRVVGGREDEPWE